MTEAVHRALERLNELLRANQIEFGLAPLDRIARLPKKVLYRASYEAFEAELPRLANSFLRCLEVEEPTSASGRQLVACVVDHKSVVGTMTVYDFVRIFITQYMMRLDSRIEAIRFGLFRDVETELNHEIRDLLQLARACWLADPHNAYAPDNVRPAVYSDLDPLSIWAYWTRQFTHPIFIDNGDRAQNRIAKGYVYDLRSAVGFKPPKGDIMTLMRGLLQEADLLKQSSIPPRAFIEINFPPFVCLVMDEMTPDFITVEALDAQDRSLPVYLFPSARRWTIPNTGCGPRNDIASFVEMANVVAAMAAAALRDFWVVEERERVLGLPRISRVGGSKNNAKRVIYLPRICYVGVRDLLECADRATQISARAAHWRSEHYRKLPEGQTPTKKQIALARAFGRSPAPGFTWVRGTTVAGLESERVYRSRSISKLLFDIIPSKGQVLTELSLFGFERYCGRWLGAQRFEVISRTTVDDGIDITAFKASAPEGRCSGSSNASIGRRRLDPMSFVNWKAHES